MQHAEISPWVLSSVLITTETNLYFPSLLEGREGGREKGGRNGGREEGNLQTCHGPSSSFYGLSPSDFLTSSEYTLSEYSHTSTVFLTFSYFPILSFLLTPSGLWLLCCWSSIGWDHQWFPNGYTLLWLTVLSVVSVNTNLTLHSIKRLLGQGIKLTQD